MSDETLMIAKGLCSKNCIDDIETLLEFTQDEFEKMGFPLGIIKKI